MASSQDLGPAVEYIAAYRATYRRDQIDAELLKRGYDAATIDDVWISVAEAYGELPPETVATRIRTVAREIWQSRFGRYLIGIGIAVGIFAIVTFFQGNEVKDYLSQQGLEVTSAEVATRIHQINVEVDTTDGAYARRVCEALRGVYATDDGREMIPVVFWEGRSYSGTAAQPCHQ